MDRAKAFEEIRRLSLLIEDHDYRYYVLSQPVVSDQEYDLLIQELKALEALFPEYIAADSPTQRVGAKVDAPRTVLHPVKMLSLDNTYSSEELGLWYDRVLKGLGGISPELVVELKIDGVSGSLVYENGVLVLGATRGDGQTGEDVTHNVRVMPSVPLKLRRSRPIPEQLELRGEIYMSKADFVRVNEQRSLRREDVFANPRNAASGSLKLLDPTGSKERKLKFFVHSFARIDAGLSFRSQWEFFQAAREWGFMVNPFTRLCGNMDDVFQACREFEAMRQSLPYDVDGVVVKVNDFRMQQQLGETMKSPRWAVAFKFQAMQATTRVKDIVVQVGRTGVLTPVAELDPVLCGGVMIARATLHNFDELARLGVVKNDRVLIERAGDVIPKIVKVVALSERREGVSRVPSNCGMCRENFIVKDADAVAYRCINPLCPKQLERRVLHFASRKAMDIEGMGEAIVLQLIAKEFIHSVADIYALRKEQLLTLDLVGNKKADNLLSAVERSKDKPLSALIFALGIPNIGEKAASTLARRFLDMETLSSACYNDLLMVADIGDVSALAIDRFFHQKETQDIISLLRGAGVNMKEPVCDGSPGKFSGRVFLFTGELGKYTREEAGALVKAYGAEVGTAVTKRTDYLVTGAAPGSKLKKALELGIAVLNEQQFEEMLHG